MQQWLETPTWSDSRRFLQDHSELASEPRTVAALEAGAEDDPGIAQHLDIARLATRKPIGEVFDAVTDLSMAVEAAMSVVEQGDGPAPHGYAVSPAANHIMLKLCKAWLTSSSHRPPTQP
jgi:hypothetical protein